MWERDLSGIWFRWAWAWAQNISGGAFALAVSDWAERTRNIELSVTHRSASLTCSDLKQNTVWENLFKYSILYFENTQNILEIGHPVN